MTLTVHHLQVGQSERIVWLCEELDIEYKLVLHQRDPIFAPRSIKDLNPLGQAPVIVDDDLALAESAACMEYIIHMYGKGGLAIAPGQKNYAQYLYWFHFANGTLQPQVMVALQVNRLDPKSSVAERTTERLHQVLAFVDERLETNEYLAGDTFSAADIMAVFTFTTMRAFYGMDLSNYSNILAWLKRVTSREGYQRARGKGDPELELMIDGKPPVSFVSKLKAAGKL